MRLKVIHVRDLCDSCSKIRSRQTLCNWFTYSLLLFCSAQKENLIRKYYELSWKNLHESKNFHYLQRCNGRAETLTAVHPLKGPCTHSLEHAYPRTWSEISTVYIALKFEYVDFFCIWSFKMNRYVWMDRECLVFSSSVLPGLTPVNTPTLSCPKTLPGLSPESW